MPAGLLATGAVHATDPVDLEDDQKRPILVL